MPDAPDGDEPTGFDGQWHECDDQGWYDEPCVVLTGDRRALELARPGLQPLVEGVTSLARADSDGRFVAFARFTGPQASYSFSEEYPEGTPTEGPKDWYVLDAETHRLRALGHDGFSYRPAACIDSGFAAYSELPLFAAGEAPRPYGNGATFVLDLVTGVERRVEALDDADATVLDFEQGTLLVRVGWKSQGIAPGTYALALEDDAPWLIIPTVFSSEDDVPVGLQGSTVMACLLQGPDVIMAAREGDNASIVVAKRGAPLRELAQWRTGSPQPIFLSFDVGPGMAAVAYRAGLRDFATTLWVVPFDGTEIQPINEPFIRVVNGVGKPAPVFVEDGLLYADDGDEEARRFVVRHLDGSGTTVLHQGAQDRFEWAAPHGSSTLLLEDDVLYEVVG